MITNQMPINVSSSLPCVVEIMWMARHISNQGKQAEKGLDVQTHLEIMKILNYHYFVACCLTFHAQSPTSMFREKSLINKETALETSP